MRYKRFTEFLDCVHLPVLKNTKKKYNVSKTGCFRPKMRRWERHTNLVSLEMANFNQRSITCLRLALSKGPNRVGISNPPPDDENITSFRNVFL
jgi:hypothetical protein